jgi:hypothetical protein
MNTFIQNTILNLLTELMNTTYVYKNHISKNNSLSKFLIRLLKDFDLTCELFRTFYIILSENIGIKNFKGVSFVKYI